MFFHNFISSLIKFSTDDLYMIMLFVCIIFMINHSFTKKYSLKKTILIWTGTCMVLELGIRVLFTIQGLVFNRHNMFFQTHQFLYNLFFGWGIWLFLLQIIILIIGTSILYKEKLNVTLFMSVTLYLFVSLIADYVMPIMLVVINPNVSADGKFILFAEGGGIYYPLIGFFISLILYFIYRKYMHKVFKAVYSMENFRLRPFTIIAGISYMSYSMLYLILSTVGVYPSTPKGVWNFITVDGSIVVIYFIMYAALYIGIVSAVKSTKLKSDLEVAARIQLACLPKDRNSDEKIKKADVYADMRPARDVGGDFYDYFMIDHKNIAFVIADVSDKGIPAALFMMMTKTAIKNNAMKYDMPSKILEATNKELYENNSAHMFVTCFLGLLNIENGNFVYANAGHNYPLVKREDETYQYLNGKNGFVLAGLENTKYKDNYLNFQEGDALFLYTDGVTEACDKHKNMYGEARLQKNLSEFNKVKHTMKETIEYIYRDISQYVGDEEQSDDITMLAFEYGGE